MSSLISQKTSAAAVARMGARGAYSRPDEDGIYYRNKMLRLPGSVGEEDGGVADVVQFFCENLKIQERYRREMTAAFRAEATKTNSWLSGRCEGHLSWAIKKIQLNSLQISPSLFLVTMKE